MPFNFPDPQTTPKFTADNGITYVWDVDDSKWQVKTTAALDDIRQDIIELEEEIDALAPSLERGKWTFTAVGTVGQPGQFTMYDADFGNGNPTGLFKSAKSIWFNEIDSDGAPHAFADVDDGELLEIFVDGSPEYGLYEVVGQAHDETQGASSFWVIDVNFVRTLTATTAVGPGELCRFKIFMAPTGGDASSFVLKSGDTMTGNLTIDKSANGPSNGGSDGQEVGLTLVGDRTEATNSAATITFENASSTYTGYLTYRSEQDGDTAFFKFNRDLELVGTLKTNKISTRSGDVTTFDKKLDFTNTDLNARFQKGFVVKKEGEPIDGTNILTVYNDFVDYDGPTNSDKRIANRKWIWDNTVRDFKTNADWSETAGLFVNNRDRGKCIKPGGASMNKWDYDFVVSSTGFGSFYVIGNNTYVRNVLKINCYTEGDSATAGKVVATNSSLRSMMGGIRQAILGATDFESLKLSLLAKLEEMENNKEFSENPSPE